MYIAKINPTVFHFNNGDAAYKFQVGIAVKPKFKKKAKAKPESRKPAFKDAHELSDKQKSPGTFTLKH